MTSPAVSAFRVRGKGVRVGYFDCFSGIAGDMTLAALVDAGVDRRAIQEAVASLGLPCELGFETVRRGGFRATYARVVTPEEHAHRHWHHIEAIIDKSILTAGQKDLAKRIFIKLGEAEAKVHGVDLAKIHFHEVGAVDSIVDIVGSAVGLDLLGVESVRGEPRADGPWLGQGGSWPDALARSGNGRNPPGGPARRIDGGRRNDDAYRCRDPRDRCRAVHVATGADDRIHRPGRGHSRGARTGQYPQAVRRDRHACQPPAIGSGFSKRTSTTFRARLSATR